MGRRKPTTKTEFVLFNVTYEDGTVTSNRRAPGEVLESLEVAQVRGQRAAQLGIVDAE